MKIVICGKYFPSKRIHQEELGGIEAATYFAVEALKADHDVTVVVHGRTASIVEQWEGFRVVRCKTNATIASQPLSLSWSRVVAGERPDLIHLHAPNLWATIMIYIFFRKVPLIISHHAEIEVRGRRFLYELAIPFYRALAKAAAKILVSSSKNLDVSKDLPVGLNNCEVVPYGVASLDFKVTDETIKRAREIRDRFSVDRFVVGFLGRLVEYKGLEVLLAAVAKCDVNCLIVGVGPLNDSLQKKAKSMGLESRVHFFGMAVDAAEKLSALCAMDVFVLPSTGLTEAFGIVQIEAQLCGLPVVTSALPTGITEVNVDGITGFHFNPGDSSDLADKLNILKRNDALRATMGKSGRERALEKFTSKTYIWRIKSIFNGIG